MTLTKKEFKKLRSSCLCKAPHRVFLNALIQIAALFRNPKNISRYRTKSFHVYECDFCGCFHIGHKGPAFDGQSALRFKKVGNKKNQRFKIMLAPCEIS